MTINHCAYNAHGIRVAVIWPVSGGWTNGLRHGSAYSAPVVFPTVEAAKADAEWRGSPAQFNWKEETA